MVQRTPAAAGQSVDAIIDAGEAQGEPWTYGAMHLDSVAYLQ
jgi:hypothetical protein